MASFSLAATDSGTSYVQPRNLSAATSPITESDHHGVRLSQSDGCRRRDDTRKRNILIRAPRAGSDVELDLGHLVAAISIRALCSVPTTPI